MRTALRAKHRRMLTRTGLGVCTLAAFCMAATQLPNILPQVDESNFAQSLRQSAWAEALTGTSDTTAWPWQTAARMSPVRSGEVHRLGLSAAFLDAPQQPADTASLAGRRNPVAKPIEGDVALGDVGAGSVGIGDSITFTANDGATCVYRVTGRRVVDPHLSSDQAEGTESAAGLFECSPLDSLIMQAAEQVRKAIPAPSPRDTQRKL